MHYYILVMNFPYLLFVNTTDIIQKYIKVIAAH